jgi:tetratricopeptide (TPR) repeat protein
VTRCPRCSGENADTQRFCGDCGTPLPVDLQHTLSLPRANETLPLPSIDISPGALFARRYRMIEELGVGGMGRVYRVLDTKLEEEIALKVIRPEAAADRGMIARFSSELKLARQVVHRNVARMFDLNEEAGIPYITMEYVRGENLKRLVRKVGRLAPAQALPIAIQICAGLAEAHGLGIVHRDLKPQNVMIDEDGLAKIMDFGLARLLAQDGREGPGSRSGSPAYISPEQIKGLPADGRADIYALGVLMYEMLTGRTPFKADSVEAIIDMHLREVPRDPREFNPAIPAELGRLILKCLEKDPASRYPGATELKTDLEALRERFRPGLSVAARRALRFAGLAGALAAAAIAALLAFGPPEAWKRSVAVLPIEDVGLEEANRKFLAGLQREVSDRLYGLPDLRVVDDFSVNSYDLTGKTSLQIGKTLGARYLVRIAVAVAGGRVDGKIYLIDTRRDVNLQPLTFQKDLVDYRTLQDEIALMAAKALGVDLAPERLKKFKRRGTDNIEAYGLFLEGMRILNEEDSEEDVRRAIDLLGRAVAIDPNYALGHWGLGYGYENFYYGSDPKDPAVLDKMYEHLDRASRLDPTFAETNLGLGWYFFNKGDNARAFECFRKALELEPDGYLVNRDSGAFLMSLGLYRPAIAYLGRAAKLSPRDPLPLAQAAQCWLFLGRLDKSLSLTRKAIAIRESDPEAGFMHAVLLVLTGRYDEAERQFQAMARFNFNLERLPFLQECAAALRRGRGRPYAFVTHRPAETPQGTYIYLMFDMKDEALANIRAGIDRGFWNGMYHYSYPSLAGNPRYRALRPDPRFQEILRGQKARYEREIKAFEKL